MPPKKIIENTVYMIDCSKCIQEKLDYFYKIYATKFFQQTKSSSDMQRVLFFNSPDHKNIEDIKQWAFYKLEKLDIYAFNSNEQNLDQAEKHTNNFLKAVKYAIRVFSEIEDTKNILIKRIVAITDLTLPINNDANKIIEIKDLMKSNNIMLYIVGVDNINIETLNAYDDISKLHTLNYLSESQPLNNDQKENFAIVQKICRQNAIIVNYEDGFNILFSYKSAIKEPYLWYVNLSIGKDLRIPVACFRSTRSHQFIKYLPAPIGDDFQNLNADKGWFDLNTHEEVPPDDVVRGYFHHGKFVTFTREQEQEMKVKTFPKCLSVFAFVDAKEISKELYFLPDSMNIIKPDMRSVHANDKGFHLFVAGLRTKNVVALAKRVYNNGFNPNLFAVFPCPEHQNDSYLLMAQLPYAHQFQERFVQGQPCKVETNDAELKMYTYGFLDAMTAGCYDDGKPIYPLSEHLKLCRNRVRQYETFANLNLNREQSESPEMSAHPILLKRADEYGELLSEICRKTEN